MLIVIYSILYISLSQYFMKLQKQAVENQITYQSNSTDKIEPKVLVSEALHDEDEF